MLNTSPHTGGSRKRPENRQPPLVSIVTVCYHAGESLPATIASVEAQTCSDYEFIVVDGGSGDRTLEVLRSSDAHIDHWISAPDKGIYDAMNKGAEMASGAYLAFLNADDRYAPDTIAQVQHALQSDRPDVLHGNMIKVRLLDGNIFERLEKPQPELMPQGMGIFHPATFVKRDVFAAAGGYDTTYKLAADYALFLKLWQEGKRFVHLDVPLAYFSLGGASNAGCETYREAIRIQSIHRTGYQRRTWLLWWKCRMKRWARQAVISLAHATGTTALLNRKVQKRWDSPSEKPGS